MNLTIFTANCAGNKQNCIYPNKCMIDNESDFMAAVEKDHVLAEYDKCYRSIDNFISSDCIVMDCDNDHSDTPEDWVDMQEFADSIPDVCVVLAPSRSHMKEKDGKSARPRFHAYFPIEQIDDVTKYTKLKTAIYDRFPFFDGNALDAARFIFGSPQSEVIWQEGDMTIDSVLLAPQESDDVIPAGRRNSTMSRFAGRVLKKFGDCDKAYDIFKEQACKCDPPLSDDELNIIWNSAQKFYKKIASQPGYIITHPIAAILLQMGLGKTAILLSAANDLLFDYFEIRRVLIIAPLRVAQLTWSDEIQKWDHLHNIKYSIAVGTPLKRKKAMEAQADIYITNRESVPWLCDNYPDFFTKDTMIVIDELSGFKSYQAKRFKALMKMRPKVDRIVGLTGTPSSNGLMDLFAEYKLLDMGCRLGRFIGQYREWYFKPDKRNGPIIYTYKLLPGAEDAIYEKISDITISMRSADILKMPELINSEYRVKLSDEELNTYKQLKNDLVVNLPCGEITAANAASLSGKLSQMANGAVYSDDNSIIHVHDRKLDALTDIIESMNGNPLLVAYWYRHDYDRITKHLTENNIPFEPLKSEESIRRWNEKKVLVGLIHPASAGHGLNLQSGGNTLVWFGLTWSLELYQQAVARLWRQGQTSGTVVIQHIITKDTIDERVMKALSEKDNTQAALIDAVSAEIGFGTVRT